MIKKGKKLRASLKSYVIEHLFDLNWDAEKGELKNTIVTRDEVASAIIYCKEKYASLGLTLESTNPGSFLKDIIRKETASDRWPEKLKKLRYTAEQRTGGKQVFEFVKYKPEQTEPFPDTFKPNLEAQQFTVQSLSMPLESKKLGRSDEPWLMQTVVNLRVIETHFAVASSCRVLQITHLQMSVKLGKGEIDALFLARGVTKDWKEIDALVTCEAKQKGEVIIETQILGQVKAAFQAFKKVDFDYVIPICVRAIKEPAGIYIIEFDVIGRPELDETASLVKVADAIYRLNPPVPGVGSQ